MNEGKDGEGEGVGKMVAEKVLYLDVESFVGKTPKDFLSHTPRYIGFYCSDTGRYFMYHIEQEDKIKRLIKRYKYIAGHNCIEYDIPILKKIPAFRFIFKNKVIFDTMKIIEKRAKPMLYHDFSMTQRGLDYQTKFFNLVDENTQKGTFDYSLMKRKNLLPRDLAKLKDYLKRDLMAGFLLFKYYYDMFSGFRDLHSPKNVANGKWLNTSSGVNSYEILCYRAGLKPIYDFDKDKKKAVRYEGAYVKQPVCGKKKGNIYSYDFACIEENEWIWTWDGYKQIKNIEYKDITEGVNKSVNQIVVKKHKFVNTLIQIELQDGTILKQTPEHRLLVDGEDKEAISIEVGNKLSKPIELEISQEGEYESIFELLGIFICEGSQFRKTYFRTDKRHPSGRNTTTSQTFLSVKNHETDFKKQIEDLFVIHCPELKLEFKPHTKNKGKISYLDIWSTKAEVYDWFKTLKDDYYNLGEITKTKGRIKAFLTGVFRSDACWNKPRKTVVLNTSDTERFNIIMKCLTCLGISYTANRMKKGYGHCKRICVLEISKGSEIDKLFSWFKWKSYRDDVVNHTKTTMENRTYINLKVVDVKVLQGKFKVYDLTIENQGNPYFIHNGVLTHNSLYPHVMIGCNLFSPVEEGYKPKGLFKDVIKGTYSSSKGKVEQVIQEAYDTRASIKKEMKSIERGSNEYKTKDKLQLAYKILINSAYGVLGSTYFPAISNVQGASDTTGVAKMCIQYAEKVFEEYGFEVLYVDTDSNYVYKPDTCFNDPGDVAQLITNDLMKDIPIPIDTFNFAHEYDINYIHFFRDDGNEFKKKHYIYQTTDGYIQFKGVGLVGGQLSPVFNLYKDDVVRGKISRFEDIIVNRSTIADWLKKMVILHPTFFTKRFRAKEKEMYKTMEGKDEPSSIQYQVSKKYGVGEHHLVPNLVMGAGKSSKYCKLEELQKTFGDKWINYVNYDKFINELKPFIVVSDR